MAALVHTNTARQVQHTLHGHVLTVRMTPNTYTQGSGIDKAFASGMCAVLLSTIAAVQERDGYAKQLAALRDDIAALSRQLAERDEDGHASADRIAQLHRQVQEWQAAAEETRRALADRESRFDDATGEHAAEMRTAKQNMAQVVQVW